MRYFILLIFMVNVIEIPAQSDCFPEAFGTAVLGFVETKNLHEFFYSKNKTNITFNYDSLMYRCCKEFMSEYKYLEMAKTAFSDSIRFTKFRYKWMDNREIEKLKFFELVQKVTKYGPVVYESEKPCKYTVVVYPIFLAPSICGNRFDDFFYTEGKFRVIGYETEKPDKILLNCLITNAFGHATNYGPGLIGLAKDVVDALKGNYYEQPNYLNSIKESYAVAAKKLMLYLREEHRKSR